VDEFAYGIGQALHTIITSGGTIIASFIQGITGQKHKVSGAGSGIAGALKGVLSKIDLFSIGANAIKGLVNGIGSMAQAVWDKVSGIADGISSGMKKLLGIHSPSRVMRDQVGKYIPLGLAAGIAGQIGAVSSAARQMAIAATPDVNFRGMTDQLNTSMRGMSSSVAGTLDVSSRITVEVPVNLDGKQIAKITAEPLRQENTRYARMINRRNGKR